MIRPRDLIEFVNEATDIVTKLKGVLGMKVETNVFYEECRQEIVAKLRELDKLKKELKSGQVK